MNKKEISIQFFKNNCKPTLVLKSFIRLIFTTIKITLKFKINEIYDSTSTMD